MSRDKAKDQEMLDRIRQRWQVMTDFYQDIYEAAADDVRFRIPGNQWPEAVKLDRDVRPCMEFDRVGAFCRQVVNEIRMSKPSIQVSPVDSAADVDTAEVLQGIIRHIEYTSNADIAYDRAADGAVTGGFGFYRLITEYVDENSFQQTIRIASIPNQFMVYIDPASIEPDGSDAEDAFINTDYSPEEFKREFPNADLASYTIDQWETVAADVPDWVRSAHNKEGQGCRVVEYWYKEYSNDILYQLQDESTILKSKFTGDPSEIVNQRKTRVCTVKCIKTNGVEILEEAVWAGKWIPIFPIYGNEFYIDGKKHIFGLVRLIKDVGRLHNYMRSAEVEAIALAPKAPWVGPVGFRGDMEREWANANRKTYSTLEYKWWDEDTQQLMPPPSRVFPEPATQAISMAIAGTDQEFKAVTGLYDASLGNRQEANQSGIAIRQLQQQGQASNFHYSDNCNRTRRHLGRCIVDLIPKVMDTPQMIRIIGEDDSEAQRMINALDPETGKIYRPGVGRYDATCSSGPSYQTKRQENLAIMMEMAKVIPAVGQLMPDMIVSQIDAPFAKQATERLKKALPPGLVDDKDKQQQQIPPQVQQDLQVMMQAMQAMQAENAQLKQELQSGLAKANLESETRIKVAEINGQYELEKVILQHGAKTHEMKHGHDMQIEMMALEPQEAPKEGGEK